MWRAYGPVHRWFAWRPVNTDDRGWRWLRLVWRRRYYIDPPEHLPIRGWEYNVTEWAA